MDDPNGTAVLSIDMHGDGDNFLTLVTFEGVSAGDFTGDHISSLNGRHAPDGDAGKGSLVIGTLGDDRLAGTEQNDKLQGYAGNDTIFGAEGRDTISGGDGDDRIEGGLGFDELTGGLGADRFVFADYAGADVILDFEVGVDLLELTDDLTITGLTEIDTDGTGGADSTLVQLSTTASVTLIDVLGLSDAAALI
ncbi:MAG: calcium-binding protein [Pseudomonadota bacterium]|nr:calcium-binding protein [Pseudomonadota bacterium]MEE3072016.1 calcium-binding protein [Pseudomonadota bacterium]